jgi:outer membrane protein assembly factor BamC
MIFLPFRCSLRPFGGLVLALSLAGCSSTSLETKKIDYQGARQSPSLEVPPDLTAPARDGRYRLPDAAGRAAVTYSGYQGAQAGIAGQQTVLTSRALGDHMQIVRSGQQRWLVVDQATPDALWAKIRQFWVQTGFSFAMEQPELGILETDWAEDRAKIPQDFVRRSLGRFLEGLYSTSERDKFRTRLEPGVKPGSIEVYISHRGMQEIYPDEAKDRTVWQPRPADPELEAEMLLRLMVHLGAEETHAQTQMGASPDASRVALVTEGAVSVLRLQADFDQAWRQLGLALDRSGFTVEDRNRAQGLYFVRYVDPDREVAKEGLLARMAFWRNREKTGLEGHRYRIRVQTKENGISEIAVLVPEGEENHDPTARRILSILEGPLR